MIHYLSWQKQDIEQQLGFRGGRFTNVNTVLCGVAALLCTVLCYTVLCFVPQNPYSAMFTERGVTPYFMVLLGFWSLFILFIKSSKIRFQKRLLKCPIVPREQNFVLSPNTADTVLANISEIVDHPKHFILFHRIAETLSNLKNLGMISDVDGILRSYSDSDSEAMETSYTLLSGFLWAIPVLGFIGTVEGLSKAIGSFGAVLASKTDTAAITSSLQNVTAGLATAFETTLLALIIALVLHLLTTVMKKREEELLMACSDYCQTNIVSRLRMPGYRNEN